MKRCLYGLKCITNLHMGNGDVNFNIVDNEVEKDPLTGFPTMFSSGVKGALRAAFEAEQKDSLNIGGIFGKARENSGSVKFLSANMLFQAVRASAGDEIYYLVTCKTLLEQYATIRKELFGDEKIWGDVQKLDDNKAYRLEDENVVGVDCFKYLGNNIAKMQNMPELITRLKEFVAEEDWKKIIVIPDNDMKKIALPVIARNILNDQGISKHLWYEEVVPHESIFYMVALASNDQDCNALNKWITENSVVQFGGNASIGCGLTKITIIKGAEE